jgi:hypothetical protein
MTAGIELGELESPSPGEALFTDGPPSLTHASRPQQVSAIEHGTDGRMPLV